MAFVLNFINKQLSSIAKPIKLLQPTLNNLLQADCAIHSLLLQANLTSQKSVPISNQNGSLTIPRTHFPSTSRHLCLGV